MDHHDVVDFDVWVFILRRYCGGRRGRDIRHFLGVWGTFRLFSTHEEGCNRCRASYPKTLKMVACVCMFRDGAMCGERVIRRVWVFTKGRSGVGGSNLHA